MLWFKNRKYFGGSSKLSTQPIVEHSTKASRLGEWLQEGTWRLTGSFVIIPPVVFDENMGRLVGAPNTGGCVIGEPVGTPLFSCYFCGTGINEHYTFTDRKTGKQVNIGNVCVWKLEEQLGQKNMAVAKGLKSLRDKVTREFKKRIHRKDMLTFLDAGMEEWQKPLNDKINAVLKGNDKAYYNPPSRTIKKGEKTFEVKTTAWEQKDGAEEREFKDRNPIKILRNDFDLRDWNVKPMIPVFEKLIKTQGFEITIPKPRTLSQEELTELAKEIQVHVDDYMKNSEVRKN